MTDLANLKVPPHSIESEHGVLGGILLGGTNALDRVFFLHVDDFYCDYHRVLYRCFKQLLDASCQIDVLIVIEKLRASGELERAGGQVYVGSLCMNTPGYANIRRYAEIVRDKAILRRLIDNSQEIVAAAYEAHAEPIAVAEQAEVSFMSILRLEGEAQVTEFKQAIGEVINARDVPTTALKTGFANLDALLKGGGMRPGQLIVVAARASMGKTVFAQNVAEYVAGSEHVLFCSMEMSRQELAERSLEYHEAKLGLSDALACWCRWNVDQLC